VKLLRISPRRATISAKLVLAVSDGARTSAGHGARTDPGEVCSRYPAAPPVPRAGPPRQHLGAGLTCSHLD
jgi:hypothetical protein